MSGWAWWWIAWIAAGLCVELVAVFRKPYGDTLSEQVWLWLHVTPGKTTIRTAVMSFRTLLVVVFLAWLIPHFALGWFT